MKKRYITLGDKEFPIRFDRRAMFRMSAMGFQNYDPEKQYAWLCAMVAAMIDTPKQLFGAEQIDERIAEMSEEETSALFQAVIEEFEESQPGKPAKKTGSGRGSGSRRGSKGTNTSD